MRRSRFLQIAGAAGALSWTASGARAAEAGHWSALAPIPAPRVGAAVAATQSEIYIFGGFSEHGERLNQSYDPEHNRWTERAPLPVPLNYAAAAAAGRFIYIAGGFSDTYAPKYRHALNAAYAYDTTADSWSPIAKLPDARGALCAVERRGRLHVLGGRDDQDAVALHSVYDPRSDSWETLAPLLRARAGFAAVYLQGFIHVLGGVVAGSRAFTVSHDAYDPLADTWRILAPMPVPRSNFGAGVLENTIVAFGGENVEGTLRSVVRYEPERDRWTDLAEMPAPRQSFATARAGNTLYLIGGGRTIGLGTPTGVNEAFEL